MYQKKFTFLFYSRCNDRHITVHFPIVFRPTKIIQIRFSGRPTLLTLTHTYTHTQVHTGHTYTDRGYRGPDGGRGRGNSQSS